jgi:hypothetical protein
MKTIVKNAADTIISMQTLPPQIDYVTPGEKLELKKAEEIIENLSESEKLEVTEYINNEIDSYYSEDENGISIAYLDSLF